MKSKHTPKRNPVQIEEDLGLIADLYAQKLPQHEITRRLNEQRQGLYELTRSAIARDIDKIRKRWRIEYTGTFNDALARELATIDKLEREAWEAWDRSKKPRQEKGSGMEEETSGEAEEGKAPAAGKRKKRSHLKQIDRDGEPRFLELVMSCVEKRSRILGLFAPERHEFFNGGKDGSDPADVDLERIETLLIEDMERRRAKGIPFLVGNGNGEHAKSN